MNHRAEFIEACAAIDGVLEHGSRFVVRFCKFGEQQHLGAQQHANLIECVAFRHLAGKELHRLAEFQRVADRKPQRLVHVGDHGDYLAFEELAHLHHQRSQALCVVHRLHKRAAADLDVEHDRVRTGGELLTHDACGNQRHTLNGARYVAKGIHLLVGGHEIARLPDHANAGFAHDLFKAVDRLPDVHAGDRFQLVDCAAGERESAP